jgi:hypothetical protein
MKAKYRVFKSGDVGGHEIPSSLSAGFTFDRNLRSKTKTNSKYGIFFGVMYGAVLSKQGESNCNAVFSSGN